jgi:hypothetical protein
MTATSTFDVFSSLDGFGGVSGNNWGGYWGKQGPNCSTTASSCPPRMSDSQTLRELTAAPKWGSVQLPERRRCSPLLVTRHIRFRRIPAHAVDVAIPAGRALGVVRETARLLAAERLRAR